MAIITEGGGAGKGLRGSGPGRSGPGAAGKDLVRLEATPRSSYPGGLIRAPECQQTGTENPPFPARVLWHFLTGFAILSGLEEAPI